MDMMKKILLALIVVLVLSISASAKPTVASAGPYNISFDLNASTEPVVVTGSENDNGSIWYYANVNFDNKTAASIGIISYDDWQDATFSSTRAKVLLLDAINESGEIRDPTLIKRTIDGCDAEVESYVSAMTNSSVTNAEYWKDSKNSNYGQVLVGKTKVELISTLSKDLNENLLNTLNIKAPVQPSTVTTTTDPNGVHRPKVAKPSVDENCMREWTDLGYTPSQISWMGWCHLS
jgi:hypothetical protein